MVVVCVVVCCAFLALAHLAEALNTSCRVILALPQREPGRGLASALQGPTRVTVLAELGLEPMAEPGLEPLAELGLCLTPDAELGLCLTPAAVPGLCRVLPPIAVLGLCLFTPSALPVLFPVSITLLDLGGGLAEVLLPCVLELELCCFCLLVPCDTVLSCFCSSVSRE